MSIRYTSGSPADVHSKIHGWTNEIQRSSARAMADAAPVTLGDAYEVRYLSAQAIASGKLLDAVHSSRWRQPLLQGRHPLGDLELDEAQEPIALHEGPGKDGLRAALNVAEKLDGDFEVCVLEAAPLHFIALWLHSDTDDWVIPFAPNLTALQNYSAIPVADALAVLQPLAATVLIASTGSDQTGG
jgi:hypothetical protein